MTEKEEAEKFTYKEALILLEKLKPLVDNYKDNGGLIIKKFSMFPLEFVKNKDLIDWYKVWGSEYDFQRNINRNLTYVIATIYRPNYTTFIIDWKVKRYLDFIDLDE